MPVALDAAAISCTLFQGQLAAVAAVTALASGPETGVL